MDFISADIMKLVPMVLLKLPAAGVMLGWQLAFPDFQHWCDYPSE